MRLDLATTLWAAAARLLSPPLLSASTREFISASRERWGVPGASVVVVSGNKTEVLSLGAADGSGRAVDPDSLFTIASNSKLFTALSVGLLIENGTVLPNGAALDWDTKVVDILDEWALMDEYASAHVDIADLASMRSGLPSHDLAQFDVPAAKTIKQLRHLRPTSELRQVWQYNNLHYAALGHIVTTLSGMPFPEFVHAHILDPLGMARTTYNATTARGWGLTDGHTHVGANGTKCVEESRGVRRMSPACRGAAKPIGWWTDSDGGAVAGAGGIITCARDLTKWLHELLAPRVLPSTLLSKLATPIMSLGLPALSPHLSAEAYGMAQIVASYRGHEIVWHTGGWPGQTSLILRAPNDGIAIAVLTNDENALAFFYSAAYRILDDLLGLAPLDMEEVLFEEELKRVPKPKTRADTPPPVGVEGLYEDKGYGRLNITRLNGPMLELLRDKFEYYDLPTDQEMYITPFKHMYTDHLVFTHSNASVWHTAIAKVHHYGGKPVVAAFVPGTAVVTEKGIGMFGGWSVPGPLAKRAPAVEEDVQEKAEVWFRRVNGLE